MADLFVDHILVKNNKDQDELDTEREIVMRLQNRILMLFFASAECQTCQEFAPMLSDFFKRLTDEFYVDRSAQLVLLYIRYDTQTDPVLCRFTSLTFNEYVSHWRLKEFTHCWKTLLTQGKHQYF